MPRCPEAQSFRPAFAEDEHDEHAARDNIHEPAVRVHPVAYLWRKTLSTSVEQYVQQQGERRDQYGRYDERQGGKEPGVVLREVHSDRERDDDV